MNQTQLITFDGESFEVLTVNNRKAMTAETIGKHLKYANPRQSINKLFNSYRDEFENGVDCSVTNTVTEAGNRETIVFFETGAILLTMFTEQPEGKRYRKIFKHILAGAAKAKPLPPRNNGFKELLRYTLECNPDYTMEDARRDNIARRLKEVTKLVAELRDYGVHAAQIFGVPEAGAGNAQLLQEHTALLKEHAALQKQLIAVLCRQQGE